MSFREHCVRRSEKVDTRDLFPTPLFATRALYEFVAPELKTEAHELTAWDPAAGLGHMCRVMEEYRHPEVIGTDIVGDGPILQENFLGTRRRADLIFTNPPYKHLEEFVHTALAQSNQHVAMLVRVQALESRERYKAIYKEKPPTNIGFFTARVPFVQGRVVRKAPNMMTFHIWMHWDKDAVVRNPPVWIPPGVQSMLEKDGDYDN